MNFPKCVVVTGMHRSGTTLLGEIINFYPGYQVVHEPFNAEYGLAGVRSVYPSCLCQDEGSYYKSLLTDSVAGSANCVRSVEGDALIKAVARKLTGGRTGVDFMKLRASLLFNKRLLPVFKDPFQVLLSGAHLEDGNKVVAVVRHPVAVWNSIIRMGWSFSYSNFANKAFFEKYINGIEFEDLENETELVKFSYLWNSINAYLLDQKLRYSERFLFFTHEELCVRPLQLLEVIEGYIGVEHSGKAESFIKENFFGTSSNIKGRELHVRKRNASALAYSWHDDVDLKDEAVIKSICGPLVKEIYGEWRAK